MARIFLLYGAPNHGKSTLAAKLKTDFGFDVIETDDAYVQFIKTRFPRIYFDDLHLYIAQHYHYVLGCHADRVREWHEHLLGEIDKRAADCDQLVVEGYLLGDCKDAYEAKLTANGNQVAQIHAEKRSYWTRASGIEQIAALGAKGSESRKLRQHDRKGSHRRSKRRRTR